MFKKQMRLFALLFFGVITILRAQEYSKQEGLWNAVFFDLPLTDQLTLRSEIHLRTTDYLNVWDQHILRPQLTYTTAKNIKWTAGYSFLRNFNADVNADPRIRNEHNLWEQLLYSVPLKKGALTTWLRLEHRFQENLPLQQDSSLRSFGFSSRIRVRVTYLKPLTTETAKTPVNFVFYDEIFTLMNPSGIPYKFNQNWAFFGFRIKLNEKMTLNTGFQKNTIFKSSEQYLTKRLWNTILFYKL
ncbi:MAG: DUF2490 domain-containing protein [Flavobacteriaceae bacterium]